MPFAAFRIPPLAESDFFLKDYWAAHINRKVSACNAKCTQFWNALYIGFYIDNFIHQFINQTLDSTQNFMIDTWNGFKPSPQPFLSIKDSDLKAVIYFGGRGMFICLHCPLHSGVILFHTYKLFLYLLSQCDNVLVHLVLTSSLPLEPIGYSYWCNCSCNFCAGLRNTVHYVLQNHCC